MLPGSAVDFEALGIQKVSTVDAATNMARRGAHFRQDVTPMLLFQHATYVHGLKPIVRSRSICHIFLSFEQ